MRADEALLYEVRDEGMLKLFFSDCLPETRLEHIRAMRAQHELKLARLRAIEPAASGAPLGIQMTLELGIGLHRWIVEWCETAERRLIEEQDHAE